MSQTPDDIYAQLAILARNPSPELEASVLPKVTSWTQYFEKAYRRADEELMLFILERKPYLSVHELQRANCYPLHELTGYSKLLKSEITLLEALLDCRYFDLSDLDGKQRPVLEMAIQSHNLDFCRVLARRNLLDNAFIQLRARHQGHLLHLRQHASWLLSLGHFRPNDHERSIFLDELNKLPGEELKNKHMRRTYIQYFGIEKFLIEKCEPIQRQYMMRMVLPKCIQNINDELTHPLARYVFADSCEFRTEEWEQIESALLDTVEIPTPAKHLNLFEYIKKSFHARWKQYSSEGTIEGIRTNPTVKDDIKRGFLHHILSLTNYSVLFCEALASSQFVAFLNKELFDFSGKNLFPTRFPRVTFALARQAPVLSEHDTRALLSYPIDTLDAVTLDSYISTVVECCGYNALMDLYFLPDSPLRPFRNITFKTHDFLWQVKFNNFTNGIESIFTQSFNTENVKFFEYLLEYHSEELMKLLRHCLISQFQLPEQHSQFHKAILKGIERRLKKPEATKEIKILMQLFSRFFGEHELRRSLGPQYQSQVDDGLVQIEESLEANNQVLQ